MTHDPLPGRTAGLRPRTLLACLPLLAICACGGSTQSHHVPPAAPAIGEFQVAPDPLTAGASGTLTAVFSGGNGAIDQGIGPVASGSPIATGALLRDTTFTLTVTGDGGTATRACTATITAAPEVPVISGPATLMAGQGGYTASVPLQPGMTYAWTIAGGTLTAGAGTAQVAFTAGQAGTLQLSCTATNAAGTASAPATLAIPVLQGPGILAFQAVPATLNAGQTGTLTWSVTGATGLSLDNGIGPVSGTSAAIVPMQSTTYTLTASNAAGSVTRTAAVQVIPQGQAPVITSFTATPATVTAGQGTVLAWSTAWAGTLDLEPGIGPVTGAQMQVFPAALTTYTLTAGNANGSATAAATVTVVPRGQPPVIASFSASPGSIAPGQGSTLAWSVTNATSLALNPGLGPVSGTSLQVSPAATTTYTLTAANAAGQVTASATVMVGNAVGYTLPGGVQLALVAIPAGSFTMGSVNAIDSFAQPPHPVTLSRAFFMGKVPVTQSQYQAVTGVNPSLNRTAPIANLPVDSVSWTAITQAGGFLDMLNTMTAAARPAGLVFRLPTEAEWEYACRAGSITEWFFGNDPSVIGQYSWIPASGGYTSATQIVGQKLPNAFGLCDLIGNVYQWCQDYWGDYSSSPQTDPAGPAAGTQRIQRGSYFNSSADPSRTAVRSFFSPSYGTSQVGFRVVLGAPLQP